MVMMPSLAARRRLWHALAGFGVGLACTIATAPFASGWTCRSLHLAAALFVCSPLLAALPALATSSPRLGAGGAATLTGVLAVVAGAANAVVVWALTQWLGGDDFRNLGAVLVFSLPFGGVPGAAYGLPLAAGTYFARRKLDLPSGSVGAGRGLLLLIAMVAAATSVFAVRATEGAYTIWLAVVAVDAVLALGCVVAAARDFTWALRLHALATDRTGAVEIVDAPDPEAPVGLRHVVTGFGVRSRPVQVHRLAVQDPGPYRASSARRALLSVDAPIPTAIRILCVGIVLLLLCAAILGWSATRATHLAPESRLECVAPF